MAHAAKTENDAGKLYKLGKPSFFIYLELHSFGRSNWMHVMQSGTPYCVALNWLKA